MSTLATLLTLIRALGRDRTRLALENAALRHQLAVLKRSVKRPRIEDSDRIFWIGMRRMLTEWKDCLFFVKPDTVIRWHRRGWRYYWRRKSQPKKQGRPPISFAVIHLIKRMSRENVTWGAPRIHDELALLRGRRLDHCEVHGQAPRPRTGSVLEDVRSEPHARDSGL